MLAPRGDARWLKGVGIVVGLGITLAMLTACGGGKAEEGFQFQKIAPSGTTYAWEDFKGVGFKKSKQYDVTELPGAVDAYMGFFGSDPYNRKQYELRFYASHEDAVELGTSPAEEVTGEDAAEHRLNPTWEEGRRDRWLSGNSASATSGQLPAAARPKYGDFAIYGNVLMLCEGAVVADALELCESLVVAVAEAGSE